MLLGNRSADHWQQPGDGAFACQDMLLRKNDMVLSTPTPLLELRAPDQWKPAIKNARPSKPEPEADSSESLPAHRPSSPIRLWREIFKEFPHDLEMSKLG